MKPDKLMNAMNELDETLISDALSYRKPKRNWSIFAATAAVIVGVGIVAIPAARWMNSIASYGIDPGTSTAETVCIEPPILDELPAHTFAPQLDSDTVELIPDGDGYLLKNLTDTDQTVVIRYPYLTSFGDAAGFPIIHREGYSEAGNGAIVFSLSSGKELAEISEDGWNIVVSEEPDLSMPTHYPADTLIGVYVLEGTDFVGGTEEFTVKFTADENIDVFTYGFEGWSKDGETYTLIRSLDGDMTAYIALVGGDVRNWQDSQMTPGMSEEKPFMKYRVNLREMTLGEFVETAIRADKAAVNDPANSKIALYEAEWDLYKQAVIDWMYTFTNLSDNPAKCYEAGQMETIMSDVRWTPRIMILNCELTVPAGVTDRITIGNERMDVVAQIVGVWQDTDSLRCMMEVTQTEGVFDITVSWSSSVSERTQWTMRANYDADAQVYRYANGVKQSITRNETGTEQIETIYENGSGELYFIDGKLYWSDGAEGIRNGCPFQKLDG